MDWNDKELNPTGIKFSGNQPKQLQVCITANVHGYFTDAKQNKFVCVSIGKDTKRVFRLTQNGYDEELSNPSGPYFVVMQQTNEILAGQVPKSGH